MAVGAALGTSEGAAVDTAADFDVRPMSECVGTTVGHGAFVLGAGTGTTGAIVGAGMCEAPWALFGLGLLTLDCSRVTQG